MEPNPSKPPPPVGGSTVGIVQKVGEHDVESKGRDPGSYPYSSSDKTVGAAMSQGVQPRPGGRPDDAGQHLPPHRLEGIAGQYNFGATVHPLQNGPPHEGIPSASSFGSSVSVQGQGQQHTPLRGQMTVGGEAPSMFPSSIAHHAKPQVSSFDSVTDSRNSPLPTMGANVKTSVNAAQIAPQSSSIEQSLYNAKGLSRTGSDVAQSPAVESGIRGGMVYQAGGLPSFNGENSSPSPQGAPRPISQSVASDLNSQAVSREAAGASNVLGGLSVLGPGGKGRDPYSPGPIGKPTSAQKAKTNENSFIGASNLPLQMAGAAPRVPQGSVGNNFGTSMQLGRPAIATNRSDPEPTKSLKSAPSAAPEQGKRPLKSDPSISHDTQGSGPARPGMPNNPGGPFNNHLGIGRPQPHKSMQHQQTHLSAVRRPLPMVGTQPPRMSAPGGAPVPSQQPPNSQEIYPLNSIRLRLDRMTEAEQKYRDKQARLQAQQPPPASLPPPSVPQQAPPQGMRELRVEDALLYLDDVKREFKDRPAIYNEFLSIMKNFKSQEVDTPGVIVRVSNLFRGYNNLILGFNTFLPDGYKISQIDLERQDAERMRQEAAERKKPTKAGAARPGPKPKKTQAATRPGPTPMHQVSSMQQAPGIQAVVAKPPPPPGPQRQQPPPGHRGRLPDEGHQLQSPQSVQMHAPHQASIPPRPSPPPVHPIIPPHPQSSVPPQSQQQLQSQPQTHRQPLQGPPTTHQVNVPAIQQQPLPQHQAVEFDHAISYVTTIKKRFANDPGTYHCFLEILHTYQKEQRGIKEVLEQVAHLFQDHPDLLKQFTFFLPDAVQEQAKERLNRAAAESESRQAAQRQQIMEQYHNRISGPAAQSQPSLVDMTRRQVQSVEPDIRGRKRQVDGHPVALVPQPESFVYNSAVERQFFDSAREALSSFTRDGGQAWAEFLKCLEMYAQETLTRSEMLNFVEPLLGKRNSNLFEEFKRILTAAGNAAGSTALVEDSWYSVPLAEIDFSRCRRCSPSYRALPRDYPAHPCSERNEAEAKVLNDVWVSLPVGSEESYTFRHMRRNAYEESLFRVEDERFEIDMAIDSNKATLHRLEPIVEEIAQLSRTDVMPSDLGLANADEGSGLGGKRFQYTFNKTVLGVIHRNAIVRIYGESGKEMLELLERNPTVAVPLVVTRLRQKQNEWLKVRTRLNRHWKELAEQNYYKSLDHRSLTWRTIDKRAISTRTLVGEIKDRAANGGREGKEAYRQKLDKAKEEHGMFYEVTVGSKLDQDLDLTYVPKPDRRLFTPHLSVQYQHVSWAQRDAYRILAFALERGQISPADKERCHRLWVEFLGPWFGLSLAWMQKPAAAYQESSSSSQKALLKIDAPIVSEDDEEESLHEDPDTVRNQMEVEEMRQALNDTKAFTDHHPLPAGADVSTLYGEGKVLQFRKSDHIYKVKLGIGASAFLRPSSVLCSMLPVENSASTRQLRTEDRSKLARPNDQLVFGTQSLYLFFRLHHVLIQRLNIAKQLAYSVGSNSSLQSLVEQIPTSNPKAVGKLRYEAYLSLLYSLLDGGIGGATEGGKYEDRVRSLLGHGGYELATMDKLISHIWKDIQIMANDENMWNLVQLYRRHLLAGSFQPEAFRQEAAYISEGEPLYAFQICPMVGSDESVLHMEYVGVMDDEDEDPMDELLEPTEQQGNKRPKR